MHSLMPRMAPPHIHWAGKRPQRQHILVYYCSVWVLASRKDGSFEIHALKAGDGTRRRCQPSASRGTLDAGRSSPRCIRGVAEAAAAKSAASRVQWFPASNSWKGCGEPQTINEPSSSLRRCGSLMFAVAGNGEQPNTP